jgi:tetratricopeptide (TPR) repeat protein
MLVFSKPMQMLGPPDTHHLSAAVGWMQLGNPAEARLELAKVAPQLAAHPDVLEIKWAVFASAGDWPGALQAADELVRSDSGRPSGWLHRAYALRRVPEGGLQAAWDALLPAVDRFPEEATMPYNLSCYACQMGRFVEAREWLRRALAVGNKTRMKAMALSDADLEPLWKEIKAL